MIILSPVHHKIRSLVLPYLDHEEGRTVGANDSQEVMLDENLRDYGGIHYHLMVQRAVGSGDAMDQETNAFTITCNCSLYEWASIREDATSELVSIFGSDAVTTGDRSCREAKGVHFTIRLDSRML
mmetsp:Transcript_15904/g.45737  ORF Transcript_15904/g.45737 Transcript_15904/m.45737 type:complete len:126 (+) Transcript_15904:66-443(+)